MFVRIPLNNPLPRLLALLKVNYQYSRSSTDYFPHVRAMASRTTSLLNLTQLNRYIVAFWVLCITQSLIMSAKANRMGQFKTYLSAVCMSIENLFCLLVREL